MKTLVFSVIFSLMTVLSASAQCVNCKCAQVKNDSVATVVDTTVSVAPVVEAPEAASTGRTVFVEPATEKYESVVLIVKNAGFNDETCTFVFGGKYYVGKTLAYELAKCYKVGYKVLSTVADPTLGAVHYILERRIK